MARELILAGRPEQVPAGVPWTGFGDYAGCEAQVCRLAHFLRPDEQRVRQALVDWLGALNIANACVDWWAHTASAKNLLSSPFGNQVLELLALQRLVKGIEAPRIAVVGATAAQRQVIVALARAASEEIRLTTASTSRELPLLPLARLVYQFAKILTLWPWMRRMRADRGADVHVLTYADAGFRDGNDTFFGVLAELLSQRRPALTTFHHAFVQGPYRRVLCKLRSATRFWYAPLFAELRVGDIFVALFASVCALFRVKRWPVAEPLEGLQLDPVLRAGLRWDIARGGYFYNVLVYRAARRLGTRLRPRLFLYPYESKSLEKLLILGIRATCSDTRLIGYQHTAITPRHTTLLFAGEEAARTPLPDRVVTVGSVTYEHLKQHGRYPTGLLTPGFALRQTQRAPYLRRTPSDDLRLLFVTSSSVSELAATARCLLVVAEHKPQWQLALRPHPEFPLRRLPNGLARELGARARDLAGTALEENLRWCDVVVYASSTVALEALVCGRAIINLVLDDFLSVDPVIEPVPLHMRAFSPNDLIAAAEQIQSLDAAEYRARAEASRRFTERYFPSPSQERLEAFLQ